MSEFLKFLKSQDVIFFVSFCLIFGFFVFNYGEPAMGEFIAFSSIIIPFGVFLLWVWKDD